VYPFHPLPKVTSLLYKELVQPKLEVGITLASLYFKKDIKVLKYMLGHATKMISSMHELSYPA
jgi:hypothetical protein